MAWRITPLALIQEAYLTQDVRGTIGEQKNRKNEKGGNLRGLKVQNTEPNSGCQSGFEIES